ncbi:hypothetical protein RHGRI_024463 [Rhododendron griersonianum]|uniref:3-beta hydroxysteroid dehydrogenase/isomerase domain-containing protein n=1 Tax=Rhododendron griersonianum TaxID=479676 RepID=A0AAV6J7E7_9ERIC|nr:hypothetical protein RHGRI_024463 [Rhododendron griersonianum]
MDHLLSLHGAKERLQLFEANLMEEGSFDSVVDGCEGVFHTASPVLLESSNPQLKSNFHISNELGLRTAILPSVFWEWSYLVDFGHVSGKLYKEQIATLEKCEERYKTVFADKISEFRRACCELFGYKVNDYTPQPEISRQFVR